MMGTEKRLPAQKNLSPWAGKNISLGREQKEGLRVNKSTDCNKEKNSKYSF